MRVYLVILVVLGISPCVLAQVMDSSLHVPADKNKSHQLESQAKTQKQMLDNKNFNESRETREEYLEKKVQRFNFQVFGVIIEAEELDVDETDYGKRIVTGPSQFDSRVEIRSLDPLINWQQQVLNNEGSVGIVVEREMIHQVTDSVYQLDISSTFGLLHHLCPDEPFRDQPVIGVGTAFIIADDLLITASHVFTRPIENYAIIFDFELLNKVGSYEAFISSKDIYYPRSVSYHSEDTDVIVFKVNRSVDKPALRWSDSKKLAHNASVYMIGHPMGLPKKAAFNAHVKTNDNPLFFYTSLDAFQGNSGSPVFSLDTHEVIGILVSGELDYKWNGSCNASTKCSIPYCTGEKVIRIEEIMSELSQH